MAVPAAPGCPQRLQWAAGADGQRKADLGQGMFLNPIVAGDHPDPTILKDGADYYMTFSSCQTYPGAVIWHSRDLVNWAPLGPALRRNIGIVWAMDLIKHGGRYFLYIPVLRDTGMAVFVTYTDDIRGGAWSDPIDLGITGHIDPGHAVGEDGHRYLFLNGIKRVRLTADGLATAGPLEHAHSPWRYPEEWVVEMFAPEGPKLLRRGNYFYMISAVGGTAGPATSHMVTLARSRSIHGPWEDCPANPIVRTKSADEPWWSRGHASVVEGPAGDWWMVYHGYENGFRTLGRHVLLEPVEWTADGWLRAKGGTLAQPMAKPRGGRPSPAAPALSDDFRTSRLGTQWVFFDPVGDESDRARIADGQLSLRAKGKSLADCSRLLCTVPDRNYEAELELELDEGTQGGLALFYDGRCHTGLGFGGGRTVVYHYGQNLGWASGDAKARRYRIKVHNVDHNATFFYSLDDGPWIKHDWQREVSGFHHNVFGGFLALRIAIFASGEGKLRCGYFRYQALPA